MSPLELLTSWITAQAGSEAGWVADSLASLGHGAAERDLHIVLGLAPRRLGKADLQVSLADLTAADQAYKGWDPSGWSLDGAARVAALLAFRGDRPFAETFKDLRRTADVAELIALYRGLPLYPEPEALAFEVGEGLRSNMRAVFEAICHRNPYPRDHFDEHRWNHMVLKALFVETALAPIVGLDERANPELARILHDYAHERWAASRPVTPELWRCAGPFATSDAALADLERALAGTRAEMAAAALALHASPAPRAANILAAYKEARDMIAEGSLSWNHLGAEEN